MAKISPSLQRKQVDVPRSSVMRDTAPPIIGESNEIFVGINYERIWSDFS
jgi:hypothetical protein